MWEKNPLKGILWQLWSFSPRHSWWRDFFPEQLISHKQWGICLWSGFQQENPFARRFFRRCRNDHSKPCWCHKSHQIHQPWGWGAEVNPFPGQSQLWTSFPIFRTGYQQSSLLIPVISRAARNRNQNKTLQIIPFNLKPLGNFPTGNVFHKYSLAQRFSLFSQCCNESGVGGSEVLHPKISQNCSQKNPEGVFGSSASPGGDSGGHSWAWAGLGSWLLHGGFLGIQEVGALWCWFFDMHP